MSRGSLFIISGPSGTGKGTVCNELIKEDNISLSISATTRDKRIGEEEGVTYYYLTKDEFEGLIKNDRMLEYANYNGNYYGTPKEAVENMLLSGKNVILEIEAQGAFKVKEKMPEAVLIFILPPSIKELKRRLIERGRESQEEIQSRINAAKWEISQSIKYNYILINDELSKCVNETLDIIKSVNEKQKLVDNLLKEI